MKKKRVVVTGLGIVAPNGIGKKEFWEAIISGRSGVGPLTRFDPSPYPTKIAAEVKNFSADDWLNKKDVQRTDRATHFAVACAKMAVADARLVVDEKISRRTGVTIGTTLGSLNFVLTQQTIAEKEGPLNVNPFMSTAGSANICSGQVSLALKAEGPSQTFSNTCASSFNAIGEATRLIREGEMDLMITGGADAPLSPTVFSGFCVSRIMSVRNGTPVATPRPFDKSRDGIILGEGGGMLVLEEMERARNRNAHIYAEVVGYATTCDAFHIVKPDPTGKSAVRAIRMALEEAELKPEDIDCIHAHGSATIAGDRIETKVIRTVMGKQCLMVPVICVKSMLGHTQGADGAMELIACLLAMENRLLPPIINYENPDPECELDVVSGKPRKVNINTVLLNCMAFGGKNAALVIRNP